MTLKIYPGSQKSRQFKKISSLSNESYATYVKKSDHCMKMLYKSLDEEKKG